MQHRFRLVLMLLFTTVVACAVALLIPSSRASIRAALPAHWTIKLNSLRHGYSIDHGIRMPMPDGVQLAASLYLPKASNNAEKLATVLVRLPYNRLQYVEALEAADYFVRQGYAVVVQDLRGKFGSEGKFIPYESATRDGVATLDWITRQPWSNGKVGTIGCSSLGETQYSLARANHPAHAAMIASGAGGGMGAAAGRYSYFGIFEGGIFQLSGGFGWFYDHGSREPPSGKIDTTKILTHLPIIDMMKRARNVPNNFDDYVATPLNDARWQRLDFVGPDDVLKVPALVINTWGDQTLGDTVALAEFMREKMPPALRKNQRVILAPGNHCEHPIANLTRFGDLEVKNTAQPYEAMYSRWFDYWLRGRGDALDDVPPYLFYVLNENRWLKSETWPPQGAAVQRWYLSSDGRDNGGANSRNGNGELRNALPAVAAGKAEYDEFRYDPMNPVPSRGGPVCCTGNPDDRSGPVEQKDVEIRDDVLIYTSPLLEAPLRIAGNLRARLVVSSSARDTDMVARLVHVWPDGRATNIQEGALRLRYRNGIDKPQLLTPNTPVEAMVDMRAIAYYLPKGHRLRLQITSSSFPRLERNLNTGGNNFDESVGVIATNRVFHTADRASYVELPVLSVAE